MYAIVRTEVKPVGTKAFAGRVHAMTALSGLYTLWRLDGRADALDDTLIARGTRGCQARTVLTTGLGRLGRDNDGVATLAGYLRCRGEEIGFVVTTCRV